MGRDLRMGMGRGMEGTTAMNHLRGGGGGSEGDTAGSYLSGVVWGGGGMGQSLGTVAQSYWSQITGRQTATTQSSGRINGLQ